ncbi:hypothetical protein Tco_0516865, partial [Tanacetum coccineum]
VDRIWVKGTMQGVHVQLVMGELITELGMQIQVKQGRLSVTTATENGVALDEEQLLLTTDGQDNAVDEDVDEQPVQDLALNVDNVFQADDCDAFDSDVDEAPTAQTMFMANLSSVDPVYDEANPSYDSDILSEVPDHDNYQDAICEHHEVHEMHDDVQPNYVEQVKLYERRAKFELTEREQKIKEQLRIVIIDRNIKEENLKKELHFVKMQLNSTIKYNKLMVEEVTSLKRDFKQKENKYLEELLEMKALKEKVEDKLYKQDQSLQTVHMLCKPKPYYDEQKKVAIGYKNPLCLTHAKQVQPALYNGHEIIKTNHVPAIVHNSEDTLEIAKITRKKMNDKMKTPLWPEQNINIQPPDYSKENYLVTFTPQTQLTPGQIFWSKDALKMKAEALKEQTPASRPIKALTLYPPNTPATLVPRVLPTKNQVKIKIFALIQPFSEFEKTCKKRITPTRLTKGERGFEQTKECYLTEVIPFIKILKEHFEGIQKALTEEIKEMKEIFEELEAEVDQNVMNMKYDEIEGKNLLIANDNLNADCLSKEVFYIATNSELTVSRFTEMHDAHSELEAELSKLNDKIQKDDHNELVKRFSNLERKIAIGYKNPLCLTHAKQVQSALYNGHEIIKTNHVSAIVHNSEDTLEIVEITKHNNDLIKMKAEALKEQTPASRPIKALTVYPPNTPAKLVPRMLPTKSQALTKEVKEMKEIFEELEAEVDQNVVNRKYDEIEKKNLLIENDNLIADCLSKEVFYIATNSKLTVLRFTEMHDAHTTVQATLLELELSLAENAKIKQHYKELYDSIKIMHAKHIEQTTALLTANENLKAQIHENMKCIPMDSVKPRVLAPGRYAIDVEPIPPRNRNNREVHLDYLKHLKESVETLHEIVEEAKVERPLDRSLASACLYTKHSQKLLEYVIGTCPKDFNKRDKKHVSTPLTRKKQVTFEDQCETSNNIIHKHIEQLNIQKTNVPMIPST